MQERNCITATWWALHCGGCASSFSRETGLRSSATSAGKSNGVMNLHNTRDPADPVLTFIVMNPLAFYLEEKGTSVAQLVDATRMDAQIVKAIVDGQYTPSPAQRQKIASVLGVA